MTLVLVFDVLLAKIPLMFASVFAAFLAAVAFLESAILAAWDFTANTPVLFLRAVFLRPFAPLATLDRMVFSSLADARLALARFSMAACFAAWRLRGSEDFGVSMSIIFCFSDPVCEGMIELLSVWGGCLPPIQRGSRSIRRGAISL